MSGHAEAEVPTKTGWCAECSDWVYVISEGVETSAWPAPERDYWVMRFECGHESATEHLAP